MKKIFSTIAILLLVNALGFSVLPFLTVLAIKFGVFPHVPDGPLLHRFSMMLTVIGPLLSIPAALASLAYCFIRSETRFWLLAAPLYVPAIYTLLTLTYFNFRI